METGKKNKTGVVDGTSNPASQETEQGRTVERFTTTGRIARSIAHEVRNPLTNILLATEQLREATSNNQEATMLLDMINRNASRINYLVSDLLNATRFAQLQYSVVDAEELANEVLAAAKEPLDKQNIALKKNYSTEKCYISADREKLKQALLNIVVNAVEAMTGRNDPTLELSTNRSASDCIIQIRDNGKGIKPDNLDAVFDPYYTTKPRGQGLGLTTSQSIILNHEGQVSVTSELGQGSVFSVSLKIHENPA